MTAPALDAAQLVADLDRLGPYASFPWHRQQQVALAQNADTIVLLGGTQGGKTQSAGGILSRLVRREGPLYRRLHHPEGRPLKIWVAPKTGEKAESVWEPLLRDFVFQGLPFSAVSHPHRVFTWADGVARENTVWIKSQDQGLLAFESDAVDCILFDEEPLDQRLYGAARGRLTTTNGVVVLAFTPLHGLTWTHSAFYVPVVRPEHQKADRYWRQGRRVAVVQMGMADNPAAVAGGGVERLKADPTLTEAERRTRLYGEYGFTEGLLFPVLAGLFADQPDSRYLLDALPTNRAYTWVLTVDPNKRHGGLLVAVDEEGIRYVVAEHYAENLPDRLHADAYRALLTRWQVPEETVAIYGDPGGAGAQALLNLADCGLYAEAVPKGPGSVKASIEMVRRALWPDPARTHPVTGKLGSPAVFFLRSLSSTWRQDGVDYTESRLLWELRQYRQKDGAPPDTPVKELDDVTDCLAGDTLVETREGPRAIQDLVGTTGEVWTPTGWQRYQDVRRAATGPTVRLRFADGRSIVCTPDHRVLTTDGWYAAAECLMRSVIDSSPPVQYVDRYESHHRRSQQSTVSGYPLSRQCHGLLPRDPQVPASGGLGGGARADSAEASHSPSGPRPGEQHPRQLGTHRTARAFAETPDAREARGGPSAPPGDAPSPTGQSRRVARLSRGIGVAPGTRARPTPLSAANSRVRTVSSSLYGQDGQGTALLEWMSSGGPTGEWEGPRNPDVPVVPPALSDQSVFQDSVLQRVVRRPARQVIAIEAAGIRDTFDLAVPVGHCFAVAGGLIVHNCLLYHYLTRPYTPVAETPVWSPPPPTVTPTTDPLSLRAAESYQRAVAKLAKQGRR